MKKRLLAVLLIVTMFGTALALSGCGSEPAGEDEKEETGTEEETGGEEKAYTIGFSVSTLDNPFFVTMADAAKEEAAKLGISLETLDAEDSSETQQQQIEDFIMKEVDLIVINPVDSDAIGTSVIACNDAEIPVITVTRASNDGQVVQHLDIDNYEAGMLDAQQAIKDLDGKGKIAVLEGIPGATSTNDRQAGFEETIKKDAPDMEIVTSLTANYDREEGASVTEDILQGNPDLNAIYAHNDEMALGAVRAVASAKKLDSIKIYGIDATDDALAAVDKGEMAATVQQQPDLQIQTALQNAVKYLNGESLEELVNIPLKLITK